MALCSKPICTSGESWKLNSPTSVQLLQSMQKLWAPAHAQPSPLWSSNTYPDASFERRLSVQTKNNSQSQTLTTAFPSFSSNHPQKAPLKAPHSSCWTCIQTCWIKAATCAHLHIQSTLLAPGVYVTGNLVEHKAHKLVSVVASQAQCLGFLTV